MKRFSWIPVVVSAVLLLIAGPVLAGDILGFSGTSSSMASSSTIDVDGVGQYDGLDDALGRADGQGQCESELGAIENPF